MERKMYILIINIFENILNNGINGFYIIFLMRITKF